MKKIHNLLFLLAVLLLSSSCNDEWTSELYDRYISFKAPVNNDGVTLVYVRYNENDTVTYEQPLIVSGTTTNNENLTVNVAVDPDTLVDLNLAQFQSRTELYYKQLDSKYFTMSDTVKIKAGENTSLLDIKFNLKGINLVNKWLLPLTVVDDPSYDYAAHPRKDYKKALLRIMPFNDYSGIYSATAYKTYLKGYENDAAIVKSEVVVYVVDEDRVFFYAGTVDEDFADRENYKIYASFNSKTKVVTFTSDNPDMDFKVNSTSYYEVEETMDATLPYLKHRYVTISNIDYNYTDYTSVPNAGIEYTVRGSLILERKINTQIPDEDQAIMW